VNAASSSTAPATEDPVLVGLSGGVDSAVAAHLLLAAGHEVEAVFMDNWDRDDPWCTAAEDLEDARRVAERLGIVLHYVSFADEYRTEVFADFLAGLRAGTTPNPDVDCNRTVKFGLLHDYARRLGARAVATGHYARRVDAPLGAELHRARDLGKDQTYFLHAIGREALERSLFPLADLTKDEVRRLARRLAFPNHAKKDSTGICFIGERPFARFLAEHLADEPGPIVDERGRVLGEHRGIAFYTIGQRRGLGIGGRRASSPAPWYVCAKDPASRTLVVTQDPHHPLLWSTAVEIDALHTLEPFAADVPEAGLGAVARYRQPEIPCRLERTGSTTAIVRTERPLHAPTPGQALVLYRGTRCLGGGRIVRAEPYTSRLVGTPAL
jgi:tRNA-specific 2-thiouridylase